MPHTAHPLNHAQSILTLADLALTGAGDSIFQRTACHAACAVALREIDGNRAAQHAEIAATLRAAETAQAQLFDEADGKVIHDGSLSDPSAAAITPQGEADTDHDLEIAVHEDFAEHCRGCALGVRKPLPFSDYRRLWLAGWNANEAAHAPGIARDSES